MNPVGGGPAGPIGGAAVQRKFARIRRAKRDLTDRTVDRERVAVLDFPGGLAADHTGVRAEAPSDGARQARDGQTCVRAERRPGGFDSIAERGVVGEPERLAERAGIGSVTIVGR